jgi:hypothetical protein
MGRTPHETPAGLVRAEDAIQIRPDVLQELALVDQDNAERRERALVLAREVAYDGELTVSGLIEGIRHYQRRTVEDCLELGKRLLLMQELTPHGEWLETLSRLGFAERTARRFMGAAFKTAKSANLADMGRRVGSAGKMLELLVLDDDEAGALLAGETVAGLKLDDVDTMTPTELRRALRDARGGLASKDRLLAEKGKKIDDLATELGKKAQGALLVQVAVGDPEEHAHQLRAELSRRVYGIEVALLGDLCKAIDALREHARTSGEPVHDLIAGHLGQLAGDVESLMLRYGAAAPSGRATADADIWDAVNRDIASRAKDDEDQTAPLN